MEITDAELTDQVMRVRSAGCRFAELNQATYNAVARCLNGRHEFAALSPVIYDVGGVTLLIKEDIPDGELRPVTGFKAMDILFLTPTEE